MPTDISFDKNLDEQLQKIAIKLTKKIIDICNDKKISDDKAIHQIRRCFKKLRALLHIYQFNLDDGFWKVQNELFKQYAKSCSDIRDSKILEDLYFKIIKKYSLDDNTNLDILKIIKDSKQNIDIKALRKSIKKAMKENIKNIKNYKLEKNNKSYIISNMKQVYNQVKVFYKEVKSVDDDLKYHSMRKWLNYYWYHHKLSKNKDPKKMKQLKCLVDTLGEIHDITIFKKLLEETEYKENSDFVKALYQEQFTLKMIALSLSKKILE
ncbi:MAG: CHAD domain-containing protein [Arcobacteraceae bacterium]|nr:CHAD domain-containing protein [Arcobacteraceae bacterium]